MRRRPYGLGMIEVLLSLVLVGIVLGLVARGYQVINQLSVVSYRMSQKLELSTFVRRMASELSCALTVTSGAEEVTFTRSDPTLNIAHDEPRDRLPWPLPEPPPAAVDLNTLNLTVRYFLDSASNEVRRTSQGNTTSVATDIGRFEVTFADRNQVATISVGPEDLTSGVTTSMYLPVVAP